MHLSYNLRKLNKKCLFSKEKTRFQIPVTSVSHLLVIGKFVMQLITGGDTNADSTRDYKC